MTVARVVPLVACCLSLAACGSAPSSRDMGAGAGDLSVVDVDAGPPECDVLAGSGCPAGDKCTIGTDDGAPRQICFAVGTVAEGGDCHSVPAGKRVGDDCAAGLSCVLYPGEGAKCRRACYSRSDCASGSACVVRTVANDVRPFDGDVRPLRACHVDDGCDPVAQSVCTGGQGCYLSGADDVGRVGVCLTPVKTGMDGAECSGLPECAPGFRCDVYGFCRRYCYYLSPTGGIPTTGQCPANEGSCQLFPYEDDQYGICGAQ